MKIKILTGLFLYFTLSSGQLWSSAAMRLSLAQLVDSADRVVVAKLVKPGVSQWGPNQRRIYTTYQFTVSEEVAGSGPKTFTIRQPGGRVGRLAQRTDGYPTFALGSERLMFVKRATEHFRVVGLSQGVFGFHQDQKWEVVHQLLEGLSFPGDHGRPLVLEKKQAFGRIRSLWQEKKLESR